MHFDNNSKQQHECPGIIDHSRLIPITHSTPLDSLFGRRLLELNPGGWLAGRIPNPTRHRSLVRINCTHNTISNALPLPCSPIAVVRAGGRASSRAVSGVRQAHLPGRTIPRGRPLLPSAVLAVRPLPDPVDAGQLLRDRGGWPVLLRNVSR